MTLRFSRWAAIYVAWVAVASLVATWALFVRLSTTGWVIELRADVFGEGLPELALWSLAMALLPVAVHRLDRRIRGDARKEDGGDEG